MFDTDYTINGRHATQLKSLAVKNSKDDTPNTGIFERYIDVYMNAALFGMIYNRTAARDNSSEDRARIYADAFARERTYCMFLYRLVMLLDESTGISKEERIDRAFRHDSSPDNDEELKKNLELFHSYVRGGIELMYERFTDGCHSKDDYMLKIHDIMESFREELDGHLIDDELLGLNDHN
ncbi:MAG: hypothetical protein IJ668_00790 [Selenomonadaceae bacterium]|nr:hypothetical protein [Selenomonadaceae bacterium]